MNTYKRHRFPPEVISYAVWLYYRFNLSHRDVEDLLAKRGITVSREAIRLWCIKFGAIYTRRLKRKHRGYGDTFYIDEVFVKINGKQLHLWRALDQDGEVVDMYLQAKRDGAAAATSVRQLGMRRFKSMKQAHRFSTAHAAVSDLFTAELESATARPSRRKEAMYPGAPSLDAAHQFAMSQVALWSVAPAMAEWVFPLLPRSGESIFDRVPAHFYQVLPPGPLCRRELVPRMQRVFWA
jgi:putative transposase